jgi:hypothetical protein
MRSLINWSMGTQLLSFANLVIRFQIMKMTRLEKKGMTVKNKVDWRWHLVDHCSNSESELILL